MYSKGIPLRIPFAVKATRYPMTAEWPFPSFSAFTLGSPEGGLAFHSHPQQAGRYLWHQGCLEPLSSLKQAGRPYIKDVQFLSSGPHTYGSVTASLVM